MAVVGLFGAVLPGMLYATWEFVLSFAFLASCFLLLMGFLGVTIAEILIRLSYNDRLICLAFAIIVSSVFALIWYMSTNDTKPKPEQDPVEEPVKEPVEERPVENHGVVATEYIPFRRRSSRRRVNVDFKSSE